MQTLGKDIDCKRKKMQNKRMQIKPTLNVQITLNVSNLLVMSAKSRKASCPKSTLFWTYFQKMRLFLTKWTLWKTVFNIHLFCYIYLSFNWLTSNSLLPYNFWDVVWFFSMAEGDLPRLRGTWKVYPQTITNTLTITKVRW